jgi:ABC transporter substrate binding protein
MVPPDAYTLVHRDLVVQSTAQHRIPAIYSYRQVIKEGGLMSYGPETSDIFQRSASYVDRILKGANPAELPAQAPAKFEFAINLRTDGTRPDGAANSDRARRRSDRIISPTSESLAWNGPINHAGECPDPSVSAEA